MFYHFYYGKLQINQIFKKIYNVKHFLFFWFSFWVSHSSNFIWVWFLFSSLCYIWYIDLTYNIYLIYFSFVMIWKSKRGSLNNFRSSTLIHTKLCTNCNVRVSPNILIKTSFCMNMCFVFSIWFSYTFVQKKKKNLGRLDTTYL